MKSSVKTACLPVISLSRFLTPGERRDPLYSSNMSPAAPGARGHPAHLPPPHGSLWPIRVWVCPICRSANAPARPPPTPRVWAHKCLRPRQTIATTTTYHMAFSADEFTGAKITDVRTHLHDFSSELMPDERADLHPRYVEHPCALDRIRTRWRSESRNSLATLCPASTGAHRRRFRTAHEVG
jgi:hypothetical protein